MTAKDFSDNTRLESLFSKLDLNKDGKIDCEELAEGLNNMGYDHISKHQIQKFLQRSDATRSGDLTLQEFVDYLQKHEKQLHFVFSKLDTNKDGRVTSSEIKVAFKNLGIVISVEEAEKLVSRLDDDNSLDISFEEWRDYLMFHPSSNIDDIIEYWRKESYLSHLDHGEDVGDVTDKFSGSIWLRHFVAGAISGVVSRTCTAPLDRLKVLLQVHGGRKQTSIKETFSYMLNEGGVKGLWRGNGINVLKIAPESALKLSAYEEIKKMIKGDDKRELEITERLLAGSAAGAFAQTVIYPLEVMKTRLALRKTGEFKGIFDFAKDMFKAEGLKVFYKGYWPNLCGIIPYAGIDLAVYETLKRYWISNYEEENTIPNKLVPLCCGTLSSCCGQVTAYPLALIRTKLQSQAGLGEKLSLPKEQTHTLGLFKYILRTEGVRGLYRGLIPNFCKVAPAVGISYYVYEEVRTRLGVEMS